LASQALEVAQSAGDVVLKARALLLIGFMNRMVGKPQESLEPLEKACELFQEVGMVAEKARCLNNISIPLLDLGDYSSGMKAAQQALELSREIGNFQQEAIALRRLAIQHQALGEYSVGIPLAEEALALSRRIGDRENELDANNVLGNLHYVINKPEKSKQYYLDSIRIAEEIGSFTLAIGNYYWNSTVPAGEYQAGFKFMQELYDNARRDGNDALAVSCHRMMLNILNDLGQYEKRQKLVGQEIVALTEQVLGNAQALGFKTNTGCNRVVMGDIDAGLQILKDVCEQLASLDDTNTYGVALTFLAFAKTFTNDPSEWMTGFDNIEQALTRIGKQDFNFMKPLTLCVEAQLHLKLGQIEDAFLVSTEMVKRLDKDRVFHWREYNLLTHVQVLRAVGCDEEADSYLQKAYERLMMVAGKTQDPTLRQSWLENVPWNREILKEARERGIATYELGNAGVA
jgi:hypothetical protein